MKMCRYTIKVYLLYKEPRVHETFSVCNFHKLPPKRNRNVIRLTIELDDNLL